MKKTAHSKIQTLVHIALNEIQTSASAVIFFFTHHVSTVTNSAMHGFDTHKASLRGTSAFETHSAFCRPIVRAKHQLVAARDDTTT